MKNYSTTNRILTVIAALIILGDIGLAGLIWKQESDARQAAWIGSYPMANQNIEWTGAGYQK